MSNIKELLKELSKSLNSNALSAAVSASNINDVTFSDEDFSQIKTQLSGFLTEESAMANPKIIESIKKSVFPMHKKTILEQVENELSPIGTKLGIDFSGAEFATDKIKLLSGAIEEKLLKGSNPDTEKLVNSLKADKESLSSKLKQFETDFVPKAELDKISQGYQAKSLQRAFALKSNSFDLQDVYKDDRIKRALVNEIWGEINSAARLEFSDDNETEIRVLQKDLDKELYVNNKAVKFDDMLTEKFLPYLKKSEPVKPVKQQDSKPTEQSANPNVNRYAAQKEKYLAMK
jgi:uncharacterized membrane-anchored protein YhcB (DUF1043 family)